jgi:hypothetical protein
MPARGEEAEEAGTDDGGGRNLMVERVKPVMIDAPVYCLKVTMKEIRPPIWRRIEVKSDITLHKLHRILLLVMGWLDYHLYVYEVGEEEYGEPSTEWLEPVKSSKVAKLREVAPEVGSHLTYIYDLGDHWAHNIEVEKILPPEPGIRYPHCRGGKRSRPPEDCGGVWGYEELLRVIRDPQDEEYASTMTWLGGSFDPEAFDLEGVNKRLRRIR